MAWLEVLLAVVAGVVLGGLLLLGRTRLSRNGIGLAWILVAFGGAVVVIAFATQPLLVMLVATAVAAVVALVGAPWAVGHVDPELRALPYWSRLRADARLRADEVRRAARPEHDIPERRDLSTPDD